MTYPSKPGFQKHSSTSRAAAEQLTTAGSMEHDIYQLLDEWGPAAHIVPGYTGDELTERLEAPHYGYAGVQTGTIAARLRGLELKGLAVKLEETRPTRSNRQAHAWVSKRIAEEKGLKTVAPAPDRDALVQAVIDAGEEYAISHATGCPDIVHQKGEALWKAVKNLKRGYYGGV